MRAMLLLAAVALSACSSTERLVDLEALRQEVLESERAFARTMADRDLDAFSEFLDDGAVFFSGEEPLQGREAVVAAWSRFFEGPEPPFAWEPQTVIVLESGTQALSTGPVFSRDGRRIATFTSIWRRDRSGRWKIVFDRGCDACASDGS